MNHIPTLSEFISGDYALVVEPEYRDDLVEFCHVNHFECQEESIGRSYDDVSETRYVDFYGNDGFVVMSREFYRNDGYTFIDAMKFMEANGYDPGVETVSLADVSALSALL